MQKTEMRWFAGIVLLGALSLVVGLFAEARADDASHKAAAIECLEVSGNIAGMKLSHLGAGKLSFIQTSKANPQNKFSDSELNLLGEAVASVSWKMMERDLIDAVAVLYTQHFTEQELKDISAFYRSGVGRKMASKMPTLTKQGMALGGRVARDYLKKLRTVPSVRDQFQKEVSAMLPADLADRFFPKK